MSRLTRALFSLVLLIGGLTVACETAALSAEAQASPILLWPQGAPNAKGTSDEDKPAITPYLPSSGKRTGAAVLVCPGGGFTIRCNDHEGVQVTQWYQERGIAAFLLRYRVVPIGSLRESLGDGRRAMQYLRAHAADFQIDTNRIGIIGFSAGAQLAGTIAMKPAEVDAKASDPLLQVSSRPDFSILVYGSVGGVVRGINTAGLTPEETQTLMQVNDAQVASSPPTFMYCTSEDGASTSMAELYIRLRKARVPTEVHFFEAGPHGTGLAQGHPILGEWPQLMHNWLRAHAYLTGDNRVALAGSVKVDGKPMARGYVFFRPLDNQNHPVGAAFVFNSGPTQGQFQLTKENGLIPGRYRVEVRQVAGRFTSNSIDAFLLNLQRKAREAGGLTDQDRAEWLAYAYKKDFTPTLEGQRVFSKARPSDAAEMTLEVKGSEPLRLDLVLATK